MTQMAADADGRQTYVIAHEDPGVHNWLDTTGLRQTIWGQRWQAFPPERRGEMPLVTGKVVKFRDLDDNLPPGVARIDRGGRSAQLAARKDGFERRFADR